MTSLTEQQLAAVFSVDKNVLVSAGAGSGKTHVLVERYIEILRNDPALTVDGIIAVTFTRKAAGEMRTRLKTRFRKLTESEAESDRWRQCLADIDSARIGTIHSLCESILKQFPAESGIDPQFEVIDEVSQAQILEESIDQTFREVIGDTLPEIKLLTDHNIEEVRNWLKQMLASSLQFNEAALMLLDLPEGELLVQLNDTRQRIQRRMLQDVIVRSDWKQAHSYLAETFGRDKLEQLRLRVVQAVEDIHEQCGKLDSTAEDAVALWQGLEVVAAADMRIGGHSDEAKAIKERLGILRSQARKLLGKPPLPASIEADDLIHFEDERHVSNLFYRAQRIYGERKKLDLKLDYNDLIGMAYTALSDSNSAARQHYQDKVRAILVDEFQDTNTIQAQLIGFLAGPTTRLFLIGDDKQSIYKFQGADVSNFNEWKQILRGESTDSTRTLTGESMVTKLTVSFRSHPNVVSFVNAVFSKLLSSGISNIPYRADFEPLSTFRKVNLDNSTIGGVGVGLQGEAATSIQIMPTAQESALIVTAKSQESTFSQGLESTISQGLESTIVAKSQKSTTLAQGQVSTSTVPGQEATSVQISAAASSSASFTIAGSFSGTTLVAGGAMAFASEPEPAQPKQLSLFDIANGASLPPALFEIAESDLVPMSSETAGIEIAQAEAASADLAEEEALRTQAFDTQAFDTQAFDTDSIHTEDNLFENQANGIEQTAPVFKHAAQLEQPLTEETTLNLTFDPSSDDESSEDFSPPRPTSNVQMVIFDGADENGDRDSEVSSLTESRAVAKWIQDMVDNEAPLLDNDGRVLRSLKYGDFAVLVAKNSNFQVIERGLLERGIPYVVFAGRGFLNRQEVIDFENLLYFLGNPQDSHALLGALRSPMFALSDDTIHELFVSMREEDRTLTLWEALLKACSTRRSGYEYVLRAVNELRRFMDDAARLSLTSLIRKIIQRTCYDLALMSAENGKQRSRNLWKLVSLAKEHEELSFFEFAKRLTLMRDFNLKQTDAPFESHDSVKLMTIHASKGLEFPAVALPCLSGRILGQDRKLIFHRNYGFALDTSRGDAETRPAWYRYAKQLDQDMEIAERKRLLYVAMTRARDYLGMFLEKDIGQQQESFRLWLAETLDLDFHDERDENRVRTVRFTGGTAEFGVSMVDRESVAPTDAELARNRNIDSEDDPVEALEQTQSLMEAVLPNPVLPTSRWKGWTRVTPSKGEVEALDATVIGLYLHSVFENLPASMERPDPFTLESIAMMQGSVVAHPQKLKMLVAEGDKLLDIFYGSELFALMKNAKRRLTELPYVFINDSGIESRRPDLLIEDENGNWLIIDYKTDDIPESAMQQQARRHAAQLEGYCRDIRQLTGLNPSIRLYFARHGKLVEPEA
ncbi:MAG: UvrD-helicase domain-containing protein [Candidatus Melainabacteria bacterium]|nr:UvrD-helicase domain-containing protein [Candidatus Melainabacteria bacterium]